ncbi:MAG: 1-acyl-sn-glycerol-3-phosphate acyltransferase, partial [Bacteroidia bacterium]|nr:1-acyl-sn-glycerol-3-phosphate acyltransferase [Bacteroidia bacterium]
MKNKTNKPGILWRAFKAYLRFIHDKIYYKKTYCINSEAIPKVGVPTLIVSNHQNCLNDPLGVQFTFRDRKPYFIARASVFELHPIANKFLRSVGLLPAFRLDYEGEGALGKNDEIFKITEKELVDGGTVVMYPEAGHQDKRWLGSFSMGYLKLAFEAAEMDNFNTEIFILPSCNHYRDYKEIQGQFMVKYGTPISLKPFYELYKTKPRTAKREVNALVREQISSLMLNIEDLDNYKAIDYIRTTFGKEYAAKRGVDINYLPDMLISDKELCAKLEGLSAESPQEAKEIFDLATQVEEGVAQIGCKDMALERKPSGVKAIAKLLLALIFAPIYLFSLWPAAFLYWIPVLMHKKLSTDIMFFGTFIYALNVLFFIPIFSVAVFFITYLNTGVWWMG